MQKRIAIVGGGFGGIIAAYLASKKGFHVTLINAAPTLGGVMASRETGDYIYDLGCHLLDGAYIEQADILREILDHEIIPYDAAYASIYKGVLRRGTELCHLSTGDKALEQQILYELLRVSDDENDSSDDLSLEDKLTRQYGGAAARLLKKVYNKVTQADISQLDACSYSVLNVGRISFLPDDIALSLKEIPYIDDRVAARSADNQLKFRLPDSEQGYRTFYPKYRGMLGFCEKAAEKLTNTGVEILNLTTCTELKIENDLINMALLSKANSQNTVKTFDALYWSGDGAGLASLLNYEEDLSAYSTSVPLVLLYFNVSADMIGDIDYVHNYDMDKMAFRISAPSRTGSTTAPKGMGYICAEVPTNVGSDIWNDAEAFSSHIWQEIIDCKMVKPDTMFPGLSYTIKTPVSYALKKLGFQKHFEQFANDYWGINNIYFPRNLSFSKAHIFNELTSILDKIV